MELFDGRFDEPHAAVVAHEFDVAEKILERIEFHQIAGAGENLKLVAFVKAHGRSEIADDERDGLAEVPIGWISDEAGTGVRVSSDRRRGCGTHWYGLRGKRRGGRL